MTFLGQRALDTPPNLGRRAVSGAHALVGIYTTPLHEKQEYINLFHRIKKNGDQPHVICI